MSNNIFAYFTYVIMRETLERKRNLKMNEIIETVVEEVVEQTTKPCKVKKYVPGALVLTGVTLISVAVYKGYKWFKGKKAAKKEATVEEEVNPEN